MPPDMTVVFQEIADTRKSADAGIERAEHSAAKDALPRTPEMAELVKTKNPPLIGGHSLRKLPNSLHCLQTKKPRDQAK